MRVSSAGTRKHEYIVGEPLLEGEILENLSLYKNGVPIDITKDATKMQWRGTWDADTVYSANDVVTYGSSIWIAPETIAEGVAPGYEPADADLGINRGVMFKESDRLSNITPRGFVIGDPPGQRRDNDISLGYGAVFLLDVTGTLPANALHVKPLSQASPGGLSLSPYASGGGYDAARHITWSSAEVIAQIEKTVDLTGLADDRYVHLYFSGGVDGSFRGLGRQ